jgi:hypothetical protein
MKDNTPTEETLALLTLLAFSEKDIEAGRVTSAEQLMEEINQWMEDNR